MKNSSIKRCSNCNWIKILTLVVASEAADKGLSCARGGLVEYGSIAGGEGARGLHEKWHTKKCGPVLRTIISFKKFLSTQNFRNMVLSIKS